MRHFVTWVFIPVFFLSFLNTISSSAAAAPQRSPNIVFIIADDLGYQELGCYGQKWIQTPHIDQIAKNGIKFTQFYSGNAVCAPSRCNLLTGKHPGHAYVRNNRNPKHLQHMKEKEGWEFPGQYPIPDAEVTIAEMLKQKNYATGAMGKWGLGHFGTTGDPNRQGFDLFYGFNCQVHAHNHYPKFLWRNNKKEALPGNDRTLYGDTHSQDKFVENGLDFIRAHQNQPFFLYLPFAIPHLAIQTPEKMLAKYRGKIPEQEYKHRGYIKHPHPRAGYAAMITQMDDGVGQIMDLLKELKLDDNTIVFFTSDNGPTYDRLGGSDSEFFESAGPWRGFKGSLYEGGIRVPLVVQWPGHIQPGEVTDHLSAFWDVMPTLADLTGTKAPTGIDGISFLPTLLDKPQQQKQHEYLYWEFPAYTGQQAVHMGDWKGVRQNLLKKRNPVMKIELYNLKKDPGEKHDVADQHPEIVARIKTIMKTGRTPSEMFPFPALDQQ